jgi:endonuclease G, mitochondrial
MISKETKGRAQTLATETAEERRLTRKFVAERRWRMAEPDAARSKAFATREIRRGAARSPAEAIQGDTIDFLPASFLVEGTVQRRAVGFIEVNTPQDASLGTGFLVSPNLLLTNQHVVVDAMAARAATVTFDREMDELGKPRAETTFTLDPDRCAIFSPEDKLDYALIAIGSRVVGSEDSANFGFCPISDTPDRHVIGMNVNIVQHPRGMRKIVALRNNLLTARRETKLLYETDTETGSSGSPVFSDSWDVVALHHYGAPMDELDENGKPIPQNVNEGIRISAIVRDLRARMSALPVSARTLVEEALQLGAVPPGQAATGRQLGGPRPGQGASGGEVLRPPALGNSTGVTSTQSDSSKGANMSTSNEGAITITVPLEITMRLGAISGASGLAGAQLGVTSGGKTATPKSLVRSSEAVKIDTNYENRKGYDPKFVKGSNIPLPAMSAKLKQGIASLRGDQTNAAKGVLDYEHFSLVLHKTRRMAIVTATNIDGKTYLEVDRKTGEVRDAEAEKWFKDTRVSDAFTLNQDFYSEWSTFFDRGHLTRRTDPTWGTAEEAERANADTFHFSNCSPQHFRFNQTAKFWQGAERYVLENGVLAADNGNRISVFQGPIFDDSIDLWADDVQIPSSFFKVIVWKGKTALKSVGLIVDQLPLMSEERRALGSPSALPNVDVSHWRVGIKTIEKKTGLDFGDAVRKADTITASNQPNVGAESAVRMQKLEDLLA